MSLFQSVFVPLCLVVTVVIAARTVRGSIGRRSGLFWSTIWLVAAVFIAEPILLTVAAHWFGIGRGADLVLYVAVLAGLAVMLYFYGRYRHLEQLVTGLIRREALSAPRRGFSPPPTPATGANGEADASGSLSEYR